MSNQTANGSHEDDRHWCLYATGEQNGFQYVVHQSYGNVPGQESDGGARASKAEGIDGQGDENEQDVYLHHGEYQTDKGKNARIRDTHGKESQTGEQGLDDGDTQDAVHYTAYRGLGKLCQFLATVAGEAIEYGYRSFAATCSRSQKDSGNDDGELEFRVSEEKNH